MTLEIKCRHNGEDWISKALNKIQNAKNEMQIQDLVLVGKNNDNFEEIFNEGTFIKKFENYFKENDEGLFNPEDVLEFLINRINNV